MRENNIKHMRGAPYHPSTNGQAERFVQTFKKALKASQERRTEQHRLDRFLLAYRNAPHALTGQAPAMLMMGHRLRMRLDVLRPDLRKKVQDKVEKPSMKVRTFEEDQEVMVKNYSSGPKWVRGTILRQNGPLSYDVQVGSKVWKRHVDQIVNTGLDVPTTPVMPMLIPEHPRTVPLPFVNNDIPPVSPAVPSLGSRKASEDVAVLESTVSAEPTWVTPKLPVSPVSRYPARCREAPKRLISEMD